MREKVAVLALVMGSSIACRGDRASPARRALAPAHLEASVPVFARFEHGFDGPVTARFTAPNGSTTVASSFLSRGRYIVRFTPRVAGPHELSVANGTQEIARGRIDARPAENARGFVRLDPQEPHRLVGDDGSQVFLLGENRINVYDPTWNYGNAGIEEYVARMKSYGMTVIRVFLFSDCEAETVDGGYQIGCLEPKVGSFDERTADAIDELFLAAERHSIDVVLVAYAIGFTPPPETWKSWEDNPYSAYRGGPALTPQSFFAEKRFFPDAARKLRYIVDRWASSPRLLAIDLLNEPEWDGPIGERTWIPWAEAMSAVWRSIDPYGHLVTAGPVGLHWNIDGDERAWYASKANDLVQWHLYGKEFYDPRALAIEMARKVDETWGFDKPVFCGEFAYGGEDKATYDHTHNGIWSLLFSGAGALAHSAPVFEIDSDEPMTPERGSHFRVLAGVLDSFDRKGVLLPARDVEATRGRAWSLQIAATGERAIWLLGPKEGYGETIEGARVSFPARRGLFHARIFDDVTGRTLAERTIRATNAVAIDLPPFRRHLAVRVSRRGD